MSKKVHITKSESAASVIGKVLNSPDDDVVVYIPKGANFSQSRNNFLLLKREAREVGKVVSVESVDDDILELATTSGLKAINPFLGKKQKAVSDIVSVHSSSDEDEVKPVLESEEHVDVEVKDEGSRFSFRRKKKKEDDDEEPVDESQEEEEVGAVYEPVVEEDDIFKNENLKLRKERKKPKLKWSTIFGAGVALLIIFVILATWVFPRVTIALEFEKTDWDFVGSLNVGTSITENRFSNDVIYLRGMSFSEKKNFTETYPATGEEFVERKAKGTMIVYNAYSSEPQELVERTRFTTPDGKVYRMDRGIIVPGAEIVDGKIVPSSIEVSVTADEAGESYNIGPVPRFRIPGFQGSPKYDGFYGESRESMAGGFVGERKVATEEDIADARENIIKTLEDAAKSQLFLNLPEGTKVIEETYRFAVTDEVIDEGGSDSETFSITIYGEARIIVFSEEELLEVFEERVEDEAGIDLAVKSYTIDYGEPRFDETGDEFSIAVSVDSVWTRPFDLEQFKKKATGKDKEALETLIFGIPGIEGGKVSFWPFWVSKVPEKETRIVVDVN